MYNDLITEFNASPALTSWSVNFNTFMMYVSSFVASAMNKAYGPRITMIIGCFFSVMGLIVTSFATNILYVLIFYGLMTGFGFSLVNIACYPIVTMYFDKYRGTVLLVSSCGVGIGQFVLPYLYFALSNAFVWKDGIFVISGLNLNYLVFAAAFMPIRLYDDSIKSEEALLRNSDKLQSETRCQAAGHSVLSCIKANFLDDLVLLKDCYFILVITSYFLTLCSVAFITTHIKAFGLSNGMTEIESTTLLSFIGIFSLIGILTMTLLMQIPGANVIVVNLIFCAGIGVSSVILGFLKTKVTIFIFVAIFGFFDGTLSAFPFVIITVVGSENISPGVGYASIAIGIGCAVGGPVGAYLCTLDPTCTISFVALGIAAIIGSTLQIPLICAVRKRNKG